MESAIAINPWAGAALSGLDAMVGYIAHRNRPWYEHEPRRVQVDAHPHFRGVHDDNGRGLVMLFAPKRIYEIWYRDTDQLLSTDGCWLTFYGSFEVDACDEDWIDVGGEA